MRGKRKNFALASRSPVPAMSDSCVVGSSSSQAPPGRFIRAFNATSRFFAQKTTFTSASPKAASVCSATTSCRPTCEQLSSAITSNW